MVFITGYFFHAHEKKNYQYFTCIWTRPSKKIQALQLETAWAQDNRNTKKGQNYAFAGEQQEGIKANTTNISNLEVNPLSTEKMNTQTQNPALFCFQPARTNAVFLPGMFSQKSTVRTLLWGIFFLFFLQEPLVSSCRKSYLSATRMSD